MTGVTNNNSLGTATAPLSDNGVLADGSSATSNADGSLTVTSPGGDVVATHSDPLPVVAIPVAIMPEAVEVAIVVPVASEDAANTPAIWSANIASAGDWTAQKVELGRAIIDIDSIYRLSINDILAEVLLENRETNVVTRIWGDAQVSVNGQDVGQFWGTSSFQLANGTLITANTVVSPNNASAYMLDKLVVTRDEHGFVVTGISNGTVDDVEIALASHATVFDHITPATGQVSEAIQSPMAPVETTTEAPVTAAVETVTSVAPKVASQAEKASPVEQSSPTPTGTDTANNSTAESTAPAVPVLVENKEALIAAGKIKVDGYDMDDDQRDGLVFVETATGWIDEWDDHAISAAVLAQTMPGGDFGPNSDIMSRSEFGVVINRFISIMTTQSFMSNIASRNTDFHSQLRDTSAEQDRSAADKQAEQRAARERMVMIGLMEAGSIAADLLNRYRGTEQNIAQAA